MKKNFIEIRFIFISLCSAAILLMGVIAFNVKNDYANVLVSRDLYDQFVWQLKRHKYIIGPQHFADRYLKIAMIKTCPVPDVAILGSSRILNLHQESFKTKNFLNLWVGGALLRDYIGLIGAFLYHHQKLPKSLIITIEPWIFNHFSSEAKDEWMKMKFYHDFMIEQVLRGKKSSWFATVNKSFESMAVYKLTDLINPQITGYNYKSVIQAKAHKSLNEYQILDEPPKIWDIGQDSFDVLVHPDGSFLIYPETFGLNDDQIAQAEQKRIKQGTMYGMENFNFDPDLIRLFDNLIMYLHQQGVQVYFFFPPYYPTVYDHMIQVPKYAGPLKMTEMYVRDVATKHGIRVVGSFSPYEVGIPANGFVDHTHFKRAATKKMFASFSTLIPELRPDE